MKAYAAQTPGPVSTGLEIRRPRSIGIQTTVRLDRTLFASRHDNNATLAPKDTGLLYKQWHVDNDKDNTEKDMKIAIFNIRTF